MTKYLTYHKNYTEFGDPRHVSLYLDLLHKFLKQSHAGRVDPIHM